MNCISISADSYARILSHPDKEGHLTYRINQAMSNNQKTHYPRVMMPMRRTSLPNTEQALQVPTALPISAACAAHSVQSASTALWGMLAKPRCCATVGATDATTLVRHRRCSTPGGGLVSSQQIIAKSLSHKLCLSHSYTAVAVVGCTTRKMSN